MFYSDSYPDLRDRSLSIPLARKAGCMKPCQGSTLDIRRSHLPASRLYPIFRCSDHYVTEWIFDIVIEIDIVGMLPGQTGLDLRVGCTGYWMGTQVIAKKKRIALIEPSQSADMQMSGTLIGWRSEDEFLPVCLWSLVERRQVVAGNMWYQRVAERTKSAHQLRCAGEILESNLHIDDVLCWQS